MSGEGSAATQRLGDFVEILSGFPFKSDAFSTDPNEGTPLIRIRDIKTHRPSCSFVGDFDAVYLISDGDIIIGMDGEFTAVRWQGVPALLNQRVLKIRSSCPDLLDDGYLFQRIQSDLAHLETVISGTTVKHLSVKDIRRLEWRLPPLDEQRRIAEVLRSVEEAISSSRVAAEAAQQASQTMRHELLGVTSDGDLADMPAGWVLQPLEALATVERGKFSIRPRNDPRFFGGHMPFIQTGDITAAGDYLSCHTQTLNELGVTVSRVFPAGTIMTTIAANIGDFTITTYPVACPDSVVGIEAHDGVNAFWLYSVLSCFKVALDRAATQNAQKNINLQTLRPLLIPVPPPDLMTELAETLEAAADAARDASTSCRQIESLKRAVMDDLLSGRVRVPA